MINKLHKFNEHKQNPLYSIQHYREGYLCTKKLSTIYDILISIFIKWCSIDCLPVLAFLGASLQLILANKNTFNYYMYLAKMDFQFRLDASGVSDGDAI
ncbi:hypothetical protein D0429_04485 [Staphylococcus auricularis]|uniref:Uncharacterized protein n=1 Tax=Staphylococcus auricularis TaxID=29379 RepID=A0AAP8PQS8_9STAP|nr:hypothetical protein [Staphylococcus auricularis]PNZ68949.1 hypothetical protein CD158_02020 [Staphylococcus auricularis]